MFGVLSAKLDVDGTGYTSVDVGATSDYFKKKKHSECADTARHRTAPYIIDGLKS